MCHKKMGHLGLPMFSLWQKDLLSKAAVKEVLEEGNLWTQVFCAKYGFIREWSSYEFPVDCSPI